MARTESQWVERNGSYLTTPWAEGRDILINGTSKYLNFGSVVGNDGYGFRDNGGTMQYKNSGGNWLNVGSGGGGSVNWGGIGGTLSDQSDLQTELSGQLSNITGLVSQGTNVSISGTGTAGDPYIISATGGGSGISLTDLSATAPLTYNNTTGEFGLPKATASVDGYLDKGDFTTFAAKQAGIMTGTVSTAVGTAAKTVTLDSPWASITPAAGDMFWITYTSGTNAAAATLNINSKGAKNIRLGNANVTALGHTIAAGGGALYRYDGSYYQVVGSTQQIDNDTTYSAISEANIKNGSSTTPGLITGQRAEQLLVQEAGVARTLSNKTLGSDLNAGSKKITNLADPAAAGDAANKKYVDDSHNARIETAANGNIAVDYANYDTYYRTGLTAACTIGAPSNVPSGKAFSIVIKDNGTARNLTFNSAYKFADGNAAPATTTVGEKTHVIVFYDGSNYLASWTNHAV